MENGAAANAIKYSPAILFWCRLGFFFSGGVGLVAGFDLAGNSPLDWIALIIFASSSSFPKKIMYGFGATRSEYQLNISWPSAVLSVARRVFLSRTYTWQTKLLLNRFSFRCRSTNALFIHK